MTAYSRYFKGKTVLLVDDEGIVLDVAMRMLEYLGFSVVVAKSGNEAIQKFESKAENIDCVILDIVMPIVDGFETLRALRNIDKSAKILLITASPTYDIQGKYDTLRMDGLLHKPVDMSELAEVLKKVLT